MTIINRSVKLLILMVLTLNIYGCGPVLTKFYVKKASLKEIEKHKEYLNLVREKGKFELLDRGGLFIVEAHKIKKGLGTVLALRLFDENDPSVMDDEEYEDITIFIPNSFSITEGMVEIDGKNGIIIFFSDGALAWALDTGCLGYAREGFLNFQKVRENELIVEIFFKADLVKNTKLSPSKCETVVVEKTLRLLSKDWSELPESEGGPGESIYKKDVFKGMNFK